MGDNRRDKFGNRTLGVETEAINTLLHLNEGHHKILNSVLFI